MGIYDTWAQRTGYNMDAESLFGNTAEAKAEGANNKMTAVAVGYNFTSKWAHQYAHEHEFSQEINDAIDRSDPDHNTNIFGEYERPSDEDWYKLQSVYKYTVCMTTKNMIDRPNHQYLDTELKDYL